MIRIGTLCKTHDLTALAIVGSRSEPGCLVSDGHGGVPRATPFSVVHDTADMVTRSFWGLFTSDIRRCTSSNSGAAPRQSFRRALAAQDALVQAVQ